MTAQLIELATLSALPKRQQFKPLRKDEPLPDEGTVFTFTGPYSGNTFRYLLIERPELVSEEEWRERMMK